MKTFDEAIKSVCLTKPNDLEYASKIWDRQLRSKQIIEEVCYNKGTRLLVAGLLQNLNLDSEELGFELIILLSNAVAQGVLIGMEMEKHEL